MAQSCPARALYACIVIYINSAVKQKFAHLRLRYRVLSKLQLAVVPAIIYGEIG